MNLGPHQRPATAREERVALHEEVLSGDRVPPARAARPDSSARPGVPGGALAPADATGSRRHTRRGRPGRACARGRESDPHASAHHRQRARSRSVADASADELTLVPGDLADREPALAALAGAAVWLGSRRSLAPPAARGREGRPPGGAPRRRTRRSNDVVELRVKSRFGGRNLGPLHEY